MKFPFVPLALSALLFAPWACAAPAPQNATLELYPTYHAVGIEVAYAGDDDGDVRGALEYRLAGETAWREGVEMTFDREKHLIWASIFRFNPGQKMEVRVTLTDPDLAAPRVLSGQVTLKTPYFENGGGATYYVAATGKAEGDGSKSKPFATFARAVKALKAGDTLIIGKGVYRQTMQLKDLRGSARKPIIIRGENSGVRAVDAPTSGQVMRAGRAYQPLMPLLTGMRSIAANSGAWTRVEGDLWSANAPDVHFGGRNEGYMSRNDLHLYRYPNVKSLREHPLDTAPEKERGSGIDLSLVRAIKGNDLESLPAWSYDAEQGKLYVVLEPGADPNRDTFDYAALASGVTMQDCRYVVVRDLEFSHFGQNAIDLAGDTDDCALVNNLIHHNRVAINMLSLQSEGNAVWNNQIYDRGTYLHPWRTWMTKLATRDAAHAILVSTGRGSSIVGNLTRGSFDAIKPGAVDRGDDIRGNRDMDIIDNVVANTADDSYELDGGGVNMRMLNNYSSNSLEGLSAAPIERGPVYIVGNRAVSRLYGFKMMNNVPSLGATFMYHNTFFVVGGRGIRMPGALAGAMLPFGNKVWKNNIIVGQGASIVNGRLEAVLDSNCYWSVPPKKSLGYAAQHRRCFGGSR